MAGQLRKLAIHHNKPLPLVDYLVPLVGDKKEVKIADIGSGPFSILGNTLDGVKIEVNPFDGKNFHSFWEMEGLTPRYPVDFQNMERLTCRDDIFDIVVCNNALDHTKDALSAVEEMIRVTKPGGWVYINCNLDQMDTGHKHYWNAKEDGMFVSKTTFFNLKDWGFKIQYIDRGGERRYNSIIATLQKA
jgi:SAM-dependent methyltransferase